MPERASAPSQEPLDVSALSGRGARTLLIRVVLTRSITLVSLIVLARLLSPAELGTYAIVAIVVTVGSWIGDLGISGALIQQRSRPTRHELAAAWTSQQLLALAGFVTVWLLAPLITTVAGLAPEQANQLRMLSFVLLLLGLARLPFAMLTRVLHFPALARIEVLQVGTNYLTAILLALAGWGVWSLVMGTIAQAALGAVLLNLTWRAWPGASLDFGPTRRMLSFATQLQLTSVLAALREAVVPVFGGLAGGVAAVGYLNFAWRNGQLASSFEEIAGRVALPAFSRLTDEPDRVRRAAQAAMLAAGLAVGAVQWWVIGVAPSLIPIVFGERWTPAVVPLQLVCLGSLALTPTRLLRSLLLAAGGAGVALRAAAVSLVVLVVGFAALTATAGLAGAGLAYAVAAGAGLVVHARASRSLVAVPWMGLLRVNVEAALAGALAWFVSTTIPGVAGLVVSAAVYVTVLGALALAFERETIEWLRSAARRRDRPPGR